MARIIVVMGVAGSGKTTVGTALADRLGLVFEDGDALHPPANVAKMARGEPLTDADREPWLQAIERWRDGLLASGASGVLACSGLRRKYRDRIKDAQPVRLAFLSVSREVAQERLLKRTKHFFRAEMLDSQFATLEEPAPDEDVRVLDARLSVQEMVEKLSDL
jgi:gluconokinase